jgi:hypothetical protein
MDEFRAIGHRRGQLQETYGCSGPVRIGVKSSNRASRSRQQPWPQETAACRCRATVEATGRARRAHVPAQWVASSASTGSCHPGTRFVEQRRYSVVSVALG